MNARLVAAFVLLIFMIPAGFLYQTIEVDPPQFQLLGFMGYVLLTAYLIATGYNQLNKGKFW